ncbi:hypothetical protein DU19_0346 [Chlamydia muridarum]|nr:hypothetical protein DU17_0348 [Chlamydia muridarum]KDU81314.1 hypothetical protein DU18_0348 [Chlamydia muridarum]KDU82806.1 hypothetical protein DU19_0346 [Chlamydia muridarum]KDU83266.1 hypothetical protein DU20_0346 [Chlamydia muridarum]KDU84478.1 hypothetical protein DU21_0348 [Chlamydia muridarum]
MLFSFPRFPKKAVRRVSFSPLTNCYWSLVKKSFLIYLEDQQTLCTL